MPKSSRPRRRHRPPQPPETSGQPVAETQAASPQAASTLSAGAQTSTPDPTRDATADAPDAEQAPANPWVELIHATELSLLDEIVERRHEWGSYRDRHPDADLLVDCATVERINEQPRTISFENWERAVLRAGVLRPTTLAGWRAKVELALTLISAGREPDQGNDDYDRMLPWLVLQDVLALLNSLDPQRAQAPNAEDTRA